MLDLTRFPVSNYFFPGRQTFCTILDRKVFFGFFELLVFYKRSRDLRTHGIVGNSTAHPMRALPGPCGAYLGSKRLPKCQKYAFGTQNHPFREISSNYENPNSKIFGHESGARLSWASCTDLRSFGRLAAAVEPYPGWSVYEKFGCAGMTPRGNVFWRLCFLDCRYT